MYGQDRGRLTAVPFPDSPREIYQQNTIKEVIAQLRFPTILQVAAEPPALFQNQLRHAYPLYQLESPIEGGFPRS